MLLQRHRGIVPRWPAARLLYWGLLERSCDACYLGSSDLQVNARRALTHAVASVAVGLMAGSYRRSPRRASSVTAELKDGVREGGSHRTRARTVLLLVQTMLSVVLLVGTGLFVRSLRRIDALPIGLDPSHVLVANVQTAGTQYTAVEVAMLYQRLLETIEGSSTTGSAALSTSLPFYNSWAVRVRVPGRDSMPRVKDGGPYIGEVTPRYFETMGMHLVQGRGFTDGDHATAHRVAVINETMARLWPHENAIAHADRRG